MKEQILKYFCEQQTTDIDYLVSDGFEGIYIKDDECPCVRYSCIEKEFNKTKAEIQPIFIEMRNDGLIELKPTVDSDYIPHGSGWFITSKGVKYAVENKIISKEDY